MYPSEHIAATTWTSQVTGRAYFFLMLSEPAQLSSGQIYFCAAGKLPARPHHLPGEQISIPSRGNTSQNSASLADYGRVTPAGFCFGTRLSRMVCAEGHIHPPDRTVSTPVNSQGHLKWKCGILALSRHTK